MTRRLKTPDDLPRRLTIFLERRFPLFADRNTVAAKILAEADRDGVDLFDALRSYTTREGAKLYGSDSFIEGLQRAYNQGEIPLYAWKAGTGRPQGSKNVKSERDVRRRVLSIAHDLERGTLLDPTEIVKKLRAAVA